jgi:hypothetical protein
MTSEVAIYRHYDADGGLIYLGQSVCPIRRLQQHSQSSDWFRDVAKVTIEWVAASDVNYREASAIRAENPKHNFAAKAVGDVIVFASKKDEQEAYKIYKDRNLPGLVRNSHIQEIVGHRVGTKILEATFGKL